MPEAVLVYAFVEGAIRKLLLVQPKVTSLTNVRAEDIGISECVTVARIGDRDRRDGNVGAQHKRPVLGSKGVGVDDTVHPKARLRREIVVKPQQVFSSGIAVRYLGLKVEAGLT